MEIADEVKCIKSIIENAKANNKSKLNTIVELRKTLGYSLHRANDMVKMYWFSPTSGNDLSEQYDIALRMVSQYFPKGDSLSAAMQVEQQTNLSFSDSADIVRLLWEEYAKGLHQENTDSITNEIIALLGEGARPMNIVVYLSHKYSLTVKEAMDKVEPFI